jgi:hypothetical protein
MAKINNEVQKDQLALHLASGDGVADRAGANGIPDRTVYSSWPRSRTSRPAARRAARSARPARPDRAGRRT